MPKKYIYCITTGRSGSVFLTELLEKNIPDSVVYHERTGWQLFGEVTPDLSHTMLYNSVGNVGRVQAFWKKKFRLDGRFAESTYIETSHLLSKAGLCENLHALLESAQQVHLIVLKRDVFKIAWSLYNRHDFSNTGATWVFYLDPRHPNTIINSDYFTRHGELGCALWYVYEMFTRAEYYKLLLAHEQKIIFHDVDLSDLIQPDGAAGLLNALGCQPAEGTVTIPAKKNEQHNFPYEGQENLLRELIANSHFDASASARRYYDAGNRLENGAIRELIFN